MENSITRIGAVMQFINEGSSRPVENTGMMAFWKSLSDDEKTEYSNAAAKQLGVSIRAN